MGWVYFISAADAVKVGKTRSLRSRASALNTDSPVTLSLLGAVLARDATRLEMLLHAKLAAHRIKGEWFASEPAQSEYVALAETHITYHEVALVDTCGAVELGDMLSDAGIARGVEELRSGMTQDERRQRFQGQHRVYAPWASEPRPTCNKKRFGSRTTARRFARCDSNQIPEDHTTLYRCMLCDRTPWHIGTRVEASRFGTGRLAYLKRPGARIRL